MRTIRGKYIHNLRILSHKVSSPALHHPQSYRQISAGGGWAMAFVRFLRDRKGGVAPMLALGIVPLVAGVGAAVDYSRANTVRTAMQNAADATALMLAKNAANWSAGQLQSNATSFFAANFHRPEAQNAQVTATYSQGQGGFTVKVDGTASVATTFMSMLGISQIPLTTTTSVNWNNAKLRVALVLDVTGSMASDGKITALKTASHNLLTQLQNAAHANGDVYVSIVPFSKDVNIGASYYNQSWIEWSEWEEINGTCSNTSYHNKTSCQSHFKTWTPANHNTWNGCVTDRDQNYDTMNTSPTSGAKFPAEQYSSCPVELMGLSYDWTTLNAKIDAMSPAGNTNQAIGLAWAWQSLTNAPLSIPAKDSSAQYKEIIILLTDGLNTENRWYTTQTAIDNRQSITCGNIKAAGITVYTVQVNTGSDPTSTLLKNCATDTNKFFLLTSANQIVTTFESIGTSISQLHLAK
jgi:Flp pilus assembly protein TadG